MVFTFSHYGRWTGSYRFKGRTLVAEGRTFAEAAIALGSMLNELTGAAA